MTRETVGCETPAILAISFIVIVAIIKTPYL
jgi:hypothetical protein